MCRAWARSLRLSDIRQRRGERYGRCALEQIASVELHQFSPFESFSRTFARSRPSQSYSRITASRGLRPVSRMKVAGNEFDAPCLCDGAILIEQHREVHRDLAKETAHADRHFGDRDRQHRKLVGICARDESFSAGSSSRHGSHHVAKKWTTTLRPRCDASATNSSCESRRANARALCSIGRSWPPASPAAAFATNTASSNAANAQSADARTRASIPVIMR